MSKLEINGLYFWRQNHWLPCGLSIIDKLWWRFIPGVIINVKWPTGELVVDHNDPRWLDLGGAVCIKFNSSDPNDHYRPWLEQHVGKQGWDWNWGMGGMDATENKLTIKIRQKYAKYATIAAVMWS
ncbi:MAG: hypothetical protein ACOVLB_02035 [Candidatus Nanopelagicus sp.]